MARRDRTHTAAASPSASTRCTRGRAAACYPFLPHFASTSHAAADIPFVQGADQQRPLASHHRSNAGSARRQSAGAGRHRGTHHAGRESPARQHPRRQSCTLTHPPSCSTPAPCGPACASTWTSVPSSQLPTDAHLADDSLRISAAACHHQGRQEATARHRLVPQPQRPPRVRVLHVQLRRRCSPRRHIQDAGTASLDLSNCFLSFPLHPSVRKYFCFRFEGALYQFTHMPFGLSTAPRVCTQLLSVVNFALSELGIRVIRLPRRLLPHQTRLRKAWHDICCSHSRTIRQFGLVVNPDKTEGPSPVAVLPWRPTRFGPNHRPCRALPAPRGRAHNLVTLSPPTASHHKGACCITDRQALLRSSGAARGSSVYAPHVGRPATVQIQATLDTHPHRPRLPGTTCASGHSSFITGTADSNGAHRERLHSSSPLTPAFVALASTSSPRLRCLTVRFDSESTPTLHASTVDSTAWPQPPPGFYSGPQ